MSGAASSKKRRAAPGVNGTSKRRPGRQSNAISPPPAAKPVTGMADFITSSVRKCVKGIFPDAHKLQAARPRDSLVRAWA
eukprot:129412-Pyramimonas_sp.AAC.1